MVVVNRVARTFGVFAAGAVLAGGLAGCAKSVAGSALSVANPTTAPSGGGSGGGGTTTPTTSAAGGGGSVSQQAQQTCSQLPKAAVTSAFGVPDVTVTTDSGTTLKGGIIQIKCVITSSNGFRANVIVQIYPSSTITTADQYFQIMRQQFTSVQKLPPINGADVAGIFQDTQNNPVVDEAFAAKKDTTSNTVDVVLAGVADTPGIQPKLVAFITALAAP